jgi:uncharacterized membrane protein
MLVVSLSPAGPAAGLNHMSVILARGRNGSVLLVVSVPSATATGNYTVTIVASSGSAFHSLTVALIVPAALSASLLRLVTGHDSVPLPISALSP